MTTNPARLALGLAALAGERVAGAAGTDALATAVGLFAGTGRMVRGTAGALAAPATRTAARGARLASRLAGASIANAPPVRRARERGRDTVAASRGEAVAAVRSGIDDAFAWLLPRAIERAMPQIRRQVLPVVIDELTADHRVRDLLAQQGRNLIDRAAEKLRGHASADAGMESTVQRMVAGRRPVAESGG